MSTATIRTLAAGLSRACRRVAPHPLWLVGPLMVIVAVPVADAFLPADIHLAHLLVVATAVTAIGAGTRATTLICFVALLALVAAGVERHALTTESVLVELCALAALSVLLFRTAHSTRLIIGDVRGKGLASISDTAIVLGAFRAAAHRDIPLPELVAYVEDAVRWGLAEFSASETDLAERFVTAVMVDIPDDEPVVQVVSCGHPPPLLLRQSGATVTTLEVPEPAPPLGLALGDMSDSAYVPATFPFQEGDRLILYTDGVTEARDQRGDFYPLLSARRTCRALGGSGARSAGRSHHRRPGGICRRSHGRRHGHGRCPKGPDSGERVSGPDGAGHRWPAAGAGPRS
ncbi:PP2C family protein-serine/threonine phosphatase [Streptomyces sp. NPDC050564]|uniref:PP2C family protein-serine/threonine phosphatase n=1 Tax=Streptomyces sp. NPDC050564 TaxID=3365631 RepID=UPI0037B9F408